MGSLFNQGLTHHTPGRALDDLHLHLHLRLRLRVEATPITSLAQSKKQGRREKIGADGLSKFNCQWLGESRL